ncbi:uroporphyrinogen-III synthase, partial [Sediminibacterium sp. C3]
FTSANAVQYFLENIDKKLLAEKNIFALQGATRDELLLRNLVPRITAPNVNELGKLIKLNKAVLNIQKILHPIGNLTLPDLRYVVTGSGMSYQDLTVYQTELNPIPVDAIPFEAILFFSPSAIDSFSFANRFSSERIYICIGNTTFTRLQYYTDTYNAVIAKN